MKFTQEQSPSGRQAVAEDAAAQHIPEAAPAPLIKASDVKAKRAEQNRGNNSNKKIHGRSTPPVKDDEVSEGAAVPEEKASLPEEPEEKVAVPEEPAKAAEEKVAVPEEPAKAAEEKVAVTEEPAKAAEEPEEKAEESEPLPEVSEETKRKIIEDAMSRPEIYEIDEGLFKGTDELSEQIDGGGDGDDAETYTYETEDKEKEPLEKKKFKSRSAVKSRRRAVITIITIVAVAALLIGGASVYAVSYDKIYPNIKIMGEDVGGMTREEVQNRLRSRYNDEDIPNITVTCEDASAELDPYALGVTFQIDETVENAYNIGRQDGVFTKIKNVIFKGLPDEDVRLIINIDEDTLRSTLDTLVSPYESYSADSYEIGDNLITFIKGEKGLYVDRESAIERIKSEFSEPSSLTIELTPDLSDPAPLNADEVFNEITSDAVAASYIRGDNGITVKEGKPHVEIEKSEVERAIKELEENDRVPVECVTQTTGKSKEELLSLLFRDTMGSYRTSFSSSNSARSSNVRLAAERINGTVLLPGETFSYDKTIGTRTTANGYKEANVYTNNKVDVGVGGGICQTSSTLYSAVLYANLEIVSRTSHSLPVSYLPAGQDATIAEGSIDFKFRNNTEYPVKIVASAGGSTVSCSIVGTKEDGISVELEHNITNKADDGSFSVASQRIVYKNGVEVKREKLSGSHYNAIEPDPTPSPSASAAPSASPAPTAAPAAIAPSESIKPEDLDFD